MRIILADDQVEVRSALRIVLEHESGFSVVGEAAEMSGLLIQAKESKPDVVLLDWELAQLRISDLLPVLKHLCPGLKVVALSGRPEASKVALAAGADAFVSKGDQPERLLNTLRGMKEKISS
ncbi:MAG TPA: response regulator [Candidatus Deferrimicrobium sp.]|nr:response regulator [Candidatus Deferrimicrobium sp.]